MLGGLGARLRLYWSMTKSLQSGLLLITGLAGYMSARCPVTHRLTLLTLAGSLFLAISGSTVLNMVLDRDVDRLMSRTCRRPLPAGRLGVPEALSLGLALSALGVGWSFALSPVYGAVVLTGLLLDVLVYTLCLKRRTPCSILIGGLAGGMPALAGRVLAIGRIDVVGLVLALAVVFWIPTHIMTFSLRYDDDYRRASIPTFPSVYGAAITRLIIALSSVAAGAAMIVAAAFIGLSLGHLRLLATLSLGLLVLAFGCLAWPSDRLNFGLFKYASTYMLSSMFLVVAGGW